ncbi:MAG TPA: hypothetical protein VK788_25410 [Terriglobales bacterium]|nr:hypothetical protein [Terriglobales bacterium]
MKIHLHIERLVLEGVSVDQPRVLRAAVEQELAGRLQHGGLSQELRSGGALPSVRGGAIELGHGAGPLRLGTQIAGAVYSGIGAGK